MEVLDQFLTNVADAPSGVDNRPPGVFCGQVRRWPLDLNSREIKQVCESLGKKTEGSVECLLQHYIFVVRGRITRLAQLLRDKKIGGVSGSGTQRLPAAIASMILEMGDVHLLLELGKVQDQLGFRRQVQVLGGCSVILQELMLPLFRGEIRFRGVHLHQISEAEHFCTAVKFGGDVYGICNWPFDLDGSEYRMVIRTIDEACRRGRFTGRYRCLVQDMLQHYKELLRKRIEQVARLLYTKFTDDVVCKILVFGSETVLRHDLIGMQVLYNFRPGPHESVAEMLRMLLVPICGRGFVKRPLPACMYQPVETSGGPSDEEDGPQD